MLTVFELISPAVPPVKLFSSDDGMGSTPAYESPESAYPFDTPPFGISVPVKRIDWTLEEGKYTPYIPKSPEIIDDSVSRITLVPYGCTELRLTVFPKID